MPVGKRTDDPYLGFRYRIEIDGLTVAGFSEVSGLQREVETEDYQEGGVNGYTHKLPKSTKYPNVVLKRGLTDADNLWKWLCSLGTQQTKVDRKSILINLLDQEGKEKVRWRCLNAYPIKWSGSEMKADANGVVIESLELVHCGIDRI